MRIVDALRDRSRLVEVLDPTSHRLTTGTPSEQQQARREWQRHKRIALIVGSGREEIPRAELEFGRFWIEHLPTGNFYRVFGGDPEFSPHVTHYYVAANSDAVMLEPLTHPASRADLEQHRAKRDARRNAPKPKRATAER